MTDVKTYEQVNRQDDNLSFGISQMRDIYALHKGKPDSPHRHNFFTILIICNAQGKHVIDFNDYPLQDEQMFFISPGQVHQVIEEVPSEGYSIVFSNQFLIQNNIPVSFIQDLNLFQSFGESPPLQLNTEELQNVLTYADEMHELHLSSAAFKYEAIGALLKLILIKCNNVCALPTPIQSLGTKNGVLSQFKNLIDAHYKSWHSTNQYASELNISPDYLNKLIKSQTGKTAKEHIQSRIIIGAKRLLYFTELSNKEIGFELGFSEPANFSAFFKKCVGISPSKFKSIH